MDVTIVYSLMELNGAMASGSESATVQIIAQNDEPMVTISNSAVATMVDEEMSATLVWMLSISEAEGEGMTATVVAGNGHLTVAGGLVAMSTGVSATGGSVASGSGDVTVGPGVQLRLTVADGASASSANLAAALEGVVYTGVENFHGMDTVTLLVVDETPVTGTTRVHTVTVASDEEPVVLGPSAGS